MIHAVRRGLSAPETLARLEALAAGAPASAPVSLRLSLGRGTTDWLTLLPADAPFWYRARPDHDEYRLAIGHALHVTSAGPNRLAALDNAFAGGTDRLTPSPVSPLTPPTTRHCPTPCWPSQPSCSNRSMASARSR